MVRNILVISLVGGITVAILLILLPDRPVGTALAVAVGFTAGQMTWKPTGIPTRKHLVACMTGAIVTFAIVFGAQTVWP